MITQAANRKDTVRKASGRPLFSAVETPALISVQIAEQMAAAIDNGQLQPGARLSSEKELVLQFGVSRVTVREALSCLQFAGYVESRRGSGTVVLAPKEARPVRTHAAVGDDAAQIIGILEARLHLEPLVVGLAADDPDPKGLKLIKQMLGGMELSLDSSKIHAHSDFRIHAAFVRTCRNSFLAQAAETLLIKCDGPLWRSIQESTWADGSLPKTWLGHHEVIARAVWEHDKELAERSAREHLMSVLLNVGASAPLGASGKAQVTRIHNRFLPKGPSKLSPGKKLPLKAKRNQPVATQRESL